jgi:hypothetical protein
MITTATAASWRVDSLKDRKAQSWEFGAADELAACQWFGYLADTGHSVELVALDDEGRARLVDEYAP